MHGKAVSQSGRWFAIAGVLLMVRAAIEFAEPAYYDPETLLDYIAATLTSVAWLATASAFARWWTARPMKRASILLLFAAMGIAASALGNFLEDVVDIPIGELLFVYGGLFGAISIMITGVALLLFEGERWSGVLLLMFTAGSTFPDDGGELLSGASLIVLGYLIHRRTATSQSSRPHGEGGHSTLTA